MSTTSRNRVIYQSQAVFSAPTGATGINAADHGLRRVQSCNYNFSVERQDINQFGELAAIDRLILQEPTVAVDMSYYFEPTGFNEKHLGLRTNAPTGTSTTSDHMLDFIISSGADFNQKNIYVLVSDPGIDANDPTKMDAATTVDGIIGIGNAFLTSWSLEASVGAIPTVTCALEAQNIVFSTGNYDIGNPAVDDGEDKTAITVTLPDGAGLFDAATEIAAVRPGDITLTLGANNIDNTPMFGVSESDLKIQSATVAMTIGREPIRKLGKAFAFAREITFPINCTLTVEAIVGNTFANKLYTLLTTNGDSTKYYCELKLVGYKGAQAYNSFVMLKGAKLDSQSFTSSIGPNQTVTIELSAQIGKNSGLHFLSATAPAA
jgi:hypothetical protein